MKRLAGEGAADDRLRAIAAEHDLAPEAVGTLAKLLEIVATDPRAPTSVTTPVEAVDVHVADSLSALPAVDALALARVVDVGSGAGFPGIPLAVARPHLELDLLEATERKCRYLEEAVAALGLTGVRVVQRRAEEWGRDDGRHAYDAVLVRAVGGIPLVLEYSAPLLRDGGAMIAWQGRMESPRPAAQAAAILGMQLDRVLPVRPYPGSRDRHLHVYRRVRPVPDSYPRRPGRARKRPLGGQPR